MLEDYEKKLKNKPESEGQEKQPAPQTQEPRLRVLEEDMAEKGSPPKTSSTKDKRIIQLISKTQAPVPLQKGRRVLEFYHFQKYKEKYDKMKGMLGVLANNLLKDTKAILETVADLVSLGINKYEVNIENLTDHVESLKYGELEDFCFKLIPQVAGYCLEAKKHFPESEAFLLLEKNFTRSITITRFQAVIITALMFFGLIPETGNDSLPRSQISLLFYKSAKHNHIKTVKLKFIFEYFRQLQKAEEAALSKQNLTYSRRCVGTGDHQFLSFWSARSEPLCPVDFNDHDKIEDCEDAIQVDFANK